MFQFIRRILLKRVKIPLNRLWFQQVRSRLDYPMMRGRTHATFRSLFSGIVQYPQSICNAGLIQAGGRWLSVFKNQTFTVNPAAGKRNLGMNDSNLKRLYVAEFDEDWQVHTAGPLQVTEGERTISDDQCLEDARLFSFKGETWMCATMGGHGLGAWPCFGRLRNGQVEIHRPQLDVQPPQKNWMPFECQGRLYLEYMVSPRRILRYDPEGGSLTFEAGEEQAWISGVIHGGAPAVRLSEEYFLGVANVQRRFWYQERYYAAVFYLFEARPPFRVHSATRPLRLNTRKERVQYVAGMVLDESVQKLFLSFGLNDYDNKIMSLDVNRITRRLREV